MLEAKSLTVRYGETTALDDVSLEVPATGRLGLVGPSGSRKSTLARVLALLLKPESGTVEIDGVRVSKWGLGSPRRLRRRVQLLWQSPRQSVDPRLRLSDIVLEPLIANGISPKHRGERRDLLEGWAGRVGLTRDLLTRFPHEVSDGQLQRACLARALILAPGYLVCDELGSMLDVSTQAALLEVIAEEQTRRDLGIVVITHDRILSDHWCDTTAEMGDISGNGRIRDTAS